MVNPADMPDRPSLQDTAWLVRAIRLGNTAAFEVVFRHYYPRLCAFAERYVRAPDVAEDLIHNVFSRMWEQRSTLNVTGTLTQYLYGAARNQALHYLRHEGIARRTHESFAPLDESPAAAAKPSQPDELVQSSELRKALRDAVSGLPHRCHSVFTLRWQHHLSYEEIASALGISRKTVENQLAIAIKTLRARLEIWK